MSIREKRTGKTRRTHIPNKNILSLWVLGCVTCVHVCTNMNVPWHGCLHCLAAVWKSDEVCTRATSSRKLIRIRIVACFFYPLHLSWRP